MLAIRMQRTGRKGHANFRVVVQDSRKSPTSGKVVAQLGHYNPHSKDLTIVKDKAEFYLSHGAQPSDRVVRLFKQEGIKLPDWVKDAPSKEGKTRNAEKLRKNRPAEAAAAVEEPAEAAQPTETAVAEDAEAPAETSETTVEEVVAEEAPAEAAAEEPLAEEVAAEEPSAQQKDEA
jgi:small subunit ribosomal protein S16